MKARVHAIAGLVAMLCIASFWGATVVSEWLLSPEAVAQAKRLVVWGLWILVPALAITGASGFSLAAGRKAALIGRKLARMRLIAANGLLVLVPSALYLEAKAAAGELDAAFIAVQALELAAGALNLALLALNARDGLRLSAATSAGRGARTSRSPPASPGAGAAATGGGRGNRA